MSVLPESPTSSSSINDSSFPYTLLAEPESPRSPVSKTALSAIAPNGKTISKWEVFKYIWDKVSVSTFLLAGLEIVANKVNKLFHLNLVIDSKNEFEVTAAYRLGMNELYGVANYNNITENAILSAMPNQNSKEWSQLVERLNGEGKKLVVISFNQDWEREERGTSRPYDQAAWKNLGVTYKEFDAIDHRLLTVKMMLDVAAFAKGEQAKAQKDGKPAPVFLFHCRGGAGRSAMGLFAHLLINEGKSKEEIIELIKKNRPLSTIGNKGKGLDELINYLNRLPLDLKPQPVAQSMVSVPAS